MNASIAMLPNDRIHVLIQDYTERPETLRPVLRVTDVGKGFLIEESFIRRAKRLFMRLMRKFRKYGAAVLFGLAVLARQVMGDVGLGDEHFPLVMGAITSAVATSFKSELGVGSHNFTITTGNSVKTALYTSSATLGASTTAYAATNEITGTGYAAGGVVIANVTPTTSGTTAIYDWADAQWTSASFTANGCHTYNDTTADKSIFVVAFGSDQTVTSGTFTIQWPTADASNAIIRIA